MFQQAFDFLGGLKGKEPKMPKMPSDEQFYDGLDKTNLLQAMTKATYKSQLKKITGIIFDRKVTIGWVIGHPKDFKPAMQRYGESKGFSSDTTVRYIAPIMYLIESHRELQEANPHLKFDWINIREEMKSAEDFQPIEGVKMTERQKKAYVPYKEVCKIRDTLEDGSDEKLLLSLYTEMEPVRSDYGDVEILDREPTKKEIGKRNYLVLGKVNKIYFNEYKTATRYSENELDLPKPVIKQITESLRQDPRKYLFCDGYGDALKPNNFNRWANRLIQKVLDNKFFTLTMFRHLYLSEGVDLKSCSFEKRKEIAKRMGHDLNQQANYVLKEPSK
jgi:hypothetical protein